MGNLSLAAPGWIEWAGVELPAILRWIGCGAAATGFYVWVQWALGANFSPLLRIKKGQTHVSEGPCYNGRVL